jgi:hypothetical protein
LINWHWNRWVGLVAVLSAGCSNKPAGTTTDGGAGNDSGIPADAGNTPDGGPTLDGGGSPDSGGSSDGGAIVCTDYNPYKNIYWGDLHTHTQYSTDAYSFGNRNSPFDAYAFAQGAARPVSAGDPNHDAGFDQLLPGRTLDFDAITDHSEWLAVTYGCGLNVDGGPFDPGSPFAGSGACNVIQSSTANNDFNASIAASNAACDGGEETGGVSACTSVTQSAWQIEQAAAAAALNPCHFTSLVAYEWTFAPGGSTLHRNIIFATDQVPALPYDSADYKNITELWNALDQGCLADAGCDVIAIPHNSNLSDGLAFAIAMDAGLFTKTNRYERLVEIHQHKGNSECSWDFDGGGNPFDPLCSFEQRLQSPPASFVRYGLAHGLDLYAQTGVDPFQFGIVAATDDHNGLPGNVAQDTWPGHVGQDDDTPAARLTKPTNENPGGITGVWAEQNTRDRIFAGLKRRETIGTSGPRIAIRFYQAWQNANYCAGGMPDGGTEVFPNNLIDSDGLPMGSTIPPGPPGSTGPYLVVSALKDVSDLQEIDIIKSTVVGGVIKDKIIAFNPLPSASAPCIQWQDPAFDAGVPALYYARVLQVPTPRWSHYDCLADPSANPTGCGSDGGLDIQEQQRAWSSPVWWLP